MADRVVDRTLWCRYEMKYCITEVTATAIANFIGPYMQLDRYCRSNASKSYPLVSLYLDSRDLQLCRESMIGKKNRFKLRIRSYTDDLSYPRFFEIKRRIDSVIVKSRAPVGYSDIDSLLSKRICLPQGNNDNDEALKQFLLYVHGINAKPIVRIRYNRQAFEGLVDDRVRVTFDRNLCYNTTNTSQLSLNGDGWQSLMPNKVVLEIKFTGHYPAWLNDMVRHFGLCRQSLSKYSLSVQKACLLRFCAPKIFA